MEVLTKPMIATQAANAQLEPLNLECPEPPNSLDALPDKSYYLSAGMEYGRYYQAYGDKMAVRYYAVNTIETKQTREKNKHRKNRR